MAPRPVSPQANFLLMGSMILNPSMSRRIVKCFAVKGWFHILVFMAGQTTTGF